MRGVSCSGVASDNRTRGTTLGRNRRATMRSPGDRPAGIARRAVTWLGGTPPGSEGESQSGKSPTGPHETRGSTPRGHGSGLRAPNPAAASTRADLRRPAKLGRERLDKVVAGPRYQNDTALGDLSPGAVSVFREPHARRVLSSSCVGKPDQRDDARPKPTRDDAKSR